MSLLPCLNGSGEDRGNAVEIAGRTLSTEALVGCATAVADRISGASAVAIDAAPCLETIVGIVGAIRAGVPVVPLPPHADDDERSRIVRETQASLILTTGATSRSVGQLPQVAVELGQRSSTHYPEPEPEQDALILYSGGTGGRPRGVRISQRAIAASVDGLADAWAWSAQDTVVQGMPLFRTCGLIVGVLGALRVGSRIVYVTDDAPAEYPAAAGTMYLGSPSTWVKIALNPSVVRSLSAARMLISVDGPLPARVFERLRLLALRAPVDGYCTTETLMTITGRADQPRLPGVTGVPLPGVETRLVDRQGQLISADEEAVGELCVRGPTLFSGYVQGPTTSTDAWHRTGDIAAITANGSYRLIGRAQTDVVRRGARLVRVVEVEDALMSYPGVSEVAVVGTPDQGAGQQIVAYVVAAEEVTAQALIDHVGYELSAYQRPRRVHFVDRLPRTALDSVPKSLLMRSSVG